MKYQLFESLREWVDKTRRSKDSKKPSRSFIFEGARVPCSGGRHCKVAPRKIKHRPEPVIAEFNTEQRSLEASWLNIKQLTEPSGLKPLSSSL